MDKNKCLAGIAIACTMIGTGAGAGGICAAVTGDPRVCVAELLCAVCMMWLAIDAVNSFRRHAREEDAK